MPDISSVRQRLSAILAFHSDVEGLSPDDIDPAVPVFGPSGIITDSLRILDALCEIEADLDISIPDEDLTEELFSSISSLETYVASRRAASDVP